jgi:hypothetical protein
VGARRARWHLKFPQAFACTSDSNSWVSLVTSVPDFSIARAKAKQSARETFFPNRCQAIPDPVRGMAAHRRRERYPGGKGTTLIWGIADPAHRKGFSDSVAGVQRSP